MALLRLEVAADLAAVFFRDLASLDSSDLAGSDPAEMTRTDLVRGFARSAGSATHDHPGVRSARVDASGGVSIHLTAIDDPCAAVMIAWPTAT